jgi:exosome complex component RRP42
MSDIDILKIIKADKAKKLLQEEKRFDNRGLLDSRNIEIKRNVMKSADGSAWVKLGNTEIIAGVKFAVGTPYVDSPEEGSLVLNLEMSGIASADIDTGPPSIDAMEYGRVVDRVIRSSECVNFKDLSIVSGEKSFIVYVDCYALNADGNLIDAAQYAAMAALLDCKIPKLDEKNNIIIKEYTDKKLKIDKEKIAVSFSFWKSNNKLLMDATEVEELASDCRFSVGVCGNNVVSYHKGGGNGTFKIEDINKIMDIAASKYLEIKNKICDKQ